MKYTCCVVTLLFITACGNCFAQKQRIADSTIEALQEVPLAYISAIDKKVDKYCKRITSKTEKTLTKLSRWENKIKDLLLKVNPAAAEQLFGNGRQTFTTVLQRIKEGKQALDTYQQQYNDYRDKLTINIKYLSSNKENLDQKFIKPLNNVKAKMDTLNSKEDESEALQQFIKERKKQLISTSIQYIGKSKYLTKINKEAWYYAETMKNYKEVFSDAAKTEQLVREVLNKVPAFSQFIEKNSMLANLFGTPEQLMMSANNTNLQTRSAVQSFMLERFAGAPNAQQVMRQNVQQGMEQLSQLKDKLINNPFAGNGDGVLPDFKPNMQKTKTFWQRTEYGFSMQFAKKNNLLPTTMDAALTAGYKINDKSVVGIGAAYKLGMGSIDKIRFSTEGINLRSFIDWKLKKLFFISGGWETNFLPGLPENIAGIKIKKWQQSALMGISKKIPFKTKWFKETKFQLLYDFLAKQHVPVSESFLFRIGYSF